MSVYLALLVATGVVLVLVVVICVVVVLVGRQLIVDLLSAPPSDAIYHFYWLEPPASAANVAYLVKIWNYSANFTHFAEVL